MGVELTDGSMKGNVLSLTEAYKKIEALEDKLNAMGTIQSGTVTLTKLSTTNRGISATVTFLTPYKSVPKVYVSRMSVGKDWTQTGIAVAWATTTGFSIELYYDGQDSQTVDNTISWLAIGEV